MSVQDTREPSKEIVPASMMLIPLALPEFRIIAQGWSTTGELEVTVIALRARALCPHCQHPSEKIHDTRARRKRDRSVRDQPVVLIVMKRRFACMHCQKTFSERDEACGVRRRTTRRFREAIGQQVETQTVEQVSRLFQVGPRFVRMCFQERVQLQLAQRGLARSEQEKLPTPRYLGIDEFAIQKGHRYATILCDLQERQVLEVSKGRQLEEVVALLGRLAHPEYVEAVSLDMSASFAPAVRKALPRATLVIDHFHVIQHLMKAFQKVVSSWAHKKEGQILLYRKQKLFLKASEDLTRQQQEERARIASHLPSLEIAWRLKEELRTWYATATVETAEAELDAWMSRVKECGPQLMQQALPTFLRWKPEILAFFRFLPTRISNGFVEGKNNRTKTIMRQAYGYRNFQNLRGRILMKRER